jgi:hypothetical protein
MGVTKVLRKLFHGHQPDVEALSCLLDGAWKPSGKALAEHGGKAACTAGRRVPRGPLLSAMQRVEAPRSFRLRAADVAGRAERAAPPPRRTAFAPYAAAAAVFVFALVLATDLATRDGADNGALLTASAPANEKFAESAADTAPQPGGAEMTLPAPAAEAGADGETGSPAPDAAGYEDDAAREQDMRSASNGQAVSDGDDGTRTEFLIAEALAGAAAAGSVGWFIASRMRRGKEEA